MLNRYYVKGYTSYGDECRKADTALVYAESPAGLGREIEAHLHIIEEGHEDGRWWLPLENSDELSDDLAHLESRLMEWAR